MGGGAAAPGAQLTRYHLSWSDFDVPGFFLHACARSDHSVSKIIIFKSAAGSISFRSTVMGGNLHDVDYVSVTFVARG